MGELGIEPATKEERKAVDLAVRAVVGKESDVPCGEVWKEVKAWLQDEKKKLQLVEALRKNKQ
jgi:hypothetical protein